MNSPNRFADQQELYRALLTGEDDAFAHLYKLLYYRVSGYVFASGGTYDDTKTVVHEAIIAFVFNLKYDKYQWRKEAELMTYLISIARYKLNEIRRRKSRYVGLDSESTIPLADDPQQTATEEQDFEARRVATEAGLNQLGDKCRQAIQLYYLQKKSMQEIAALLGWANENVARKEKYRCLQKLRQLIGLSNWTT